MPSRRAVQMGTNTSESESKVICAVMYRVGKGEAEAMEVGTDLGN